MTLSFRAILAALVLGCGGVLAQQPAPAGMSLATAAARRFPQSVRVGNLIDRPVLQPLESQPVLGHVAQIVRSGDGVVKVVVDYGGLFGIYGGLFGIGARPIAVPVDAMALLGTEMEVVDFTPKQLSGFPTYDGAGAIPIAPDVTIRVGLARPSH